MILNVNKWQILRVNHIILSHYFRSNIQNNVKKPNGYMWPFYDIYVKTTCKSNDFFVLKYFIIIVFLHALIQVSCYLCKSTVCIFVKSRIILVSTILLQILILHDKFVFSIMHFNKYISFQRNVIIVLHHHWTATTLIFL